MPFDINIIRYGIEHGERVIIGLTWQSLLIIAFLAAFTFLVHFIVREFLNPTGHTVGSDEISPEQVESELESQGIEEVNRFSFAQRASHWIMAISIFLLLLSGFLILHTEVTIKPLFGLTWLVVHEIGAIVLTGYVIFHIGHVAYKGTWDTMWFTFTDLKDQLTRLKNFFSLTDEYPRQFKYPGAQKILHWSITLATLGLIVTGLVLLRRVNFRPLWEATREFSLLGITFDMGTSARIGLVGWSFVLHDLFAMGIVALVMGHIYFATRPQEWTISKSMITGSVPVHDYAEKYSPESWPVGKEASADGGSETVSEDKGDRSENDE